MSAPGCVLSLLHVGGGGKEGGGGAGGGQGGEGREEELRVLLWATDNDDLAKGVIDRMLVHAPEAILVFVDHQLPASDRHDLNCWQHGCEAAGLVDLEFLGLADKFVGSAGSTFSFAAHARALVPPHYASFMASGQGLCAQGAGSTEAGLLIEHVGGAMHTDCAIVQHEATARCRSVFPEEGEEGGEGGGEREGAKEGMGCIGFFSAHLHIGQCLQQLIGQCSAARVAGDAGWGRGVGGGGGGVGAGALRKFAVGLNHALMLESFHARYGYFFESLHPRAPLHFLPRCLSGSDFEWHPSAPKPSPRPPPSLPPLVAAAPSAYVLHEPKGNPLEKEEEKDDDEGGQEGEEGEEDEVEDQTWLVNVARPGEGAGGWGGARGGASLAVVPTGSGFVSNNAESVLDGNRGAQGGAWVMHGNLSAAFAVLALPAHELLHCINVYSGVGLPDGHVTEMAVWVTDTVHDGYTAQRLTSPEMLALKARWTLVELSGVAGGDYKKGLRGLPAAGSRTRRVRGSLRRIGGSWLRVGARLRHINAEHMSLSLYSLIEVGGQRRWRSGVRANGLKVKFLCRMTNDTNFTSKRN
jgi:hypothetical protein